MKNLANTYLAGHEGRVSESALAGARASFAEAYKNAHHALNTAAKLYSRHLSTMTAKTLDHPTYLHSAAKRGIYINSFDDVKIIEKVARYGKFMAHGCFIFSAALGVDEVYETYEHHGDVWGAVGKVVAEIGSAIVAGAICAYIITPAGWLTVAAAAIVEGVGISWIAEGAGHIGKDLGDDAHEAYSWVRHHLPSWL